MASSVMRRVGAEKPFPRARHGGKGVCVFWLAGNCSRNPCRFAHVQSLPSSNHWVWRRDTGNNNVVEKSSGPVDCNAVEVSEKPSVGRIYKTEEAGNCVEEDIWDEVHPSFRGEGLSMVARLRGHGQAVSGVELPVGSSKLFSCARDGTLMLWDCESGKLFQTYNLGDEIGSMISAGTWIFVGTPNAVKALNFKYYFDLSLSGPVGQVYAMVVAKDMLFAGGQDGAIFAWREGDCEASLFPTAGCLRGHTKAVVCLTAMGNRLYSGSMDNTIRVWDLDSLQCVETLVGHSDVVMSLLCWDRYLLSCSLDNTVKIWAANKGDKMELTYTHEEEDGVIKLSGMHDAVGKSILFCGCNDNSVRLYELPSFVERGRLFAEEEVRAIKIGPEGLFFTGDATGLVTVWKWTKKSEPGSSRSS